MNKALYSARKLRVAVIGCGDHVREDILPPLALNNRVVLALAVDPSDFNRTSASTAFSIADSVADFHAEEFEGKIDAAIVAGPPSLHERAIRELTAIGINLLIEKPASLSLENLHRYINLASAHNAKVFVGHNFRHSLAYGVLQAHIQTMQGTPQLAEISYHASLPVGQRWGLPQLDSLLLSHFGHVQDLISDFFPWRGALARCDSSELSNGRTSALISIRFANRAIASFSISSLAPRFVLSVRVTSDIGEVVHLESLRRVSWYGFKSQGNRETGSWEPRTLESGLALAGYAHEVDSFVSACLDGTAAFPLLSDVLPAYEVLSQILSWPSTCDDASQENPSK